MPTLLPRDSDNQPIPVMRLRAGGAHSVSVTDSSARNSTAFDADTRVVGLYADIDVFINIGGASVTADTSDHFLPAGLYYDIAVGGGATGHASHIAAIRAGAEDGTLYISEKE